LGENCNLLEKWTAGAKIKWMKNIVAEHEKALVRYTLSLVKDLEAARDIVQEAFLRLWQQDPEGVQGHAKKWLFTVCRNLAMDRFRGQQKQDKYSKETMAGKAVVDNSAEDQLIHNSDKSVVGQAMKQLSEKQQEVLRLKFQDGLSYKEISELTGLSVSHVGVEIHNAIKIVRQKMKKQKNQFPLRGGGQ